MATYDSLERSNYDGSPVDLYEFATSQTAWRYTSARVDQVVGGNTYTAVAISDDGITVSSDASDDEFHITMPANELTEILGNNPPSNDVYVTVRRKHYGETEAPVVWSGIYKSIKRENALTCKIVCQAITSSLRRLGLTLAFSRNCPYTLYDVSCGVSRTGYAQAVTVMSTTGNSFIHNGPIPAGADYYSGGFIEFTANGMTERRPIEKQLGSTISLLTTTDGITIGTVVTMYPGCDRTTSTCNAKFNNLSNYGGFPQLPTKSPFDFDPIF